MHFVNILHKTSSAGNIVQVGKGNLTSQMFSFNSNYDLIYMTTKEVCWVLPVLLKFCQLLKAFSSLKTGCKIRVKMLYSEELAFYTIN